MNVGDADAGVDAGARGLGQRLAAGLDVGGNRAGESADGGALDLLRDLSTASKSSGEDAGKPASMISTFSRANWRARVILSRLPRRVPAACSPSLRVVSNTAIFDVAFIPASSMNVLNLLLLTIPYHGARKKA